MRRSLLFVLSLSFATPALTLCPGLVEAHDYEMKDLEALEKQEAWHEALAHLGDIPPSKRNDNWQRIADKSAAGELASLEGRAVLRTAEDLLKRYPTLKKSKVFMQGRADSGLKAFGKTYADSRHSSGDDPWLAELQAFVEADTLTPDLSLRAGKLVTSRLVAYIAIPLFKKAVGSNAGACKDAEVKKSLVSALADDVWQDDAKLIVDKSCWNDVRPALEVELAKAGDAVKKNACPLFAAKKVTAAACK